MSKAAGTCAWSDNVHKGWEVLLQDFSTNPKNGTELARRHPQVWGKISHSMVHFGGRALPTKAGDREQDILAARLPYSLRVRPVLGPWCCFQGKPKELLHDGFPLRESSKTGQPPNWLVRIWFPSQPKVERASAQKSGVGAEKPRISPKSPDLATREEWLVCEGVPADLRDDEGKNLLFYAASHACPELTAFLLSRGSHARGKSLTHVFFFTN